MTNTETQTSFPLPPGNFGLPLLGEIDDFRRDNPQNFVEKRHQKYGSIFKTSLLWQRTIYVCGIEACRFVLNNENVYFQNNMPPNIKALIGSSAVTIQTGNKHRNRRQLLQKVFTSQYLNKQAQTIQEITQNYCRRWEKSGKFVWYPELQNYSFDIAGKLFIDKDCASSSTLGKLYGIWSEGLFSFSLPLPWTKLGRALQSRKKILRQIEKIIYQRQKENNLEKSTDALSLLLQARDEEGNSLSLEEIKEQILNLLSAGHGTLASALTSFCLLLAQNPEILYKCRQEQQQLGASSLSPENLKSMIYLEKVLKEVLRKIPPVGGGFRKVIKECSFNGYLFPKGWQVIYQISSIHQEPELFAFPDTFNPERFSSTSQDFLEGYIPFGGGRRRCLGESLARLEMKIFAATLVRNYSWELSDNQDLEIELFPFPHPRDDLKVHFQRI
jgi:cytochrome P450